MALTSASSLSSTGGRYQHDTGVDASRTNLIQRSVMIALEEYAIIGTQPLHIGRCGRRRAGCGCRRTVEHPTAHDRAGLADQSARRSSRADGRRRPRHRHGRRGSRSALHAHRRAVLKRDDGESPGRSSAIAARPRSRRSQDCRTAHGRPGRPRPRFSVTGGLEMGVAHARCAAIILLRQRQGGRAR